MSKLRGKEFEKKLIQSFKTLPDTYVKREKDQQSFFKGSKNDCDLTIYKNPYLFKFEAKSIKGDRFSFSNIESEQFLGLLNASKIKGIIAGVIVWFIDYKKVYYININYIERLIRGDFKSIDIYWLRDLSKHKNSVIDYHSETKVIYPEFINTERFLKEVSFNEIK